MDVNTVKPVPVVQPPRKVERERHDRDQKRRPAEDTDRGDEDDGGKGIDTYA